MLAQFHCVASAMQHTLACYPFVPLAMVMQHLSYLRTLPQLQIVASLMQQCSNTLARYPFVPLATVMQHLSYLRTSPQLQIVASLMQHTHSLTISFHWPW